MEEFAKLWKQIWDKFLYPLINFLNTAEGSPLQGKLDNIIKDAEDAAADANA